MHLPETAHLYAILNFAQIHRKTYLEPELESYLIGALLRFSDMPLQEEYSWQEEEVEKIMNSPELSRKEFLKDIADYCLLSSGLLSDQFSGEECNFDQFQQVGQDAFMILSEQEKDKENIYTKINRNFYLLVDILQCSQFIMHGYAAEDFPDTTVAGENDDAIVEEEIVIHCLPSSLERQNITYH